MLKGRCGVNSVVNNMVTVCTTWKYRLQAPLDACSASVHEFRIPSKALLGLHSYCPIHFDTFHSVLVDTTVHISLLKSGSSRTPSRAPRLGSTFYMLKEQLLVDKIKNSFQFMYLPNMLKFNHSRGSHANTIHSEGKAGFIQVPTHFPLSRNCTYCSLATCICLILFSSFGIANACHLNKAAGF